MFTKIDIKKFGLYKDFMWGGLPKLGRVNIIYGRNYSGKTTLSRIFDSVGQGLLHKDYPDGEFTLYTENDAIPTVTQNNMKDCPYLVRVYNADYVNRNLRWLKDEETGEIKPFALIGSENVEAQKAIDEIDAKLGSIEEKKGLLYEDDLKNKAYKTKKDNYDEAFANLEWQLKNKANGDIKKQNIYVKQGTNYIVNNIKRDIDEFVTAEQVKVDEQGQELEKPRMVFVVDDSVVLSEDEKSQLKITVEEKEKTTIAELSETPSLLNKYAEEVRTLVTKKITLSKTLQELVDNDLLQAWVDKGRELNKDRELCAFCGNPIGEKRWEDLNAHFSKESEELKQSLTTLREKLEKASEGLDGFLEAKNITEQNIYAAYTAEYKVVKEKWDDYVTRYKVAVNELLTLVDERLGNIFKPLSYESDPYDIDEQVYLLHEINGLTEKNNEYGLKLDSAKESVRKKLRLDYVHQFCEDIKYAEVMTWLAKEKEELEVLEHAMMIRATEIGELRNRRKQKELDKKDEGKAAQKVTELLKNHFGNGSLSLEPVTVVGPIVVGDPEASQQLRTKFVVKRGGQNAKNLSEGEKSLISFCYFIAQMTDELKGPDAGKLVVYIDDPISSLDSSHIFFMYSLIETVFIKKICFGQLFISTHNLEFLKFMKRIRPKVTEGCKTKCHYVVVKLGKGTTDDYKSEIRQMPEYLSKYMTEYNYLFEQIYEIAMLDSEEEQTLYGERYTQYYNIGNNMRKFLECYLFNRYPNADDPLAVHLADLFDDHVPSEVNRVVNEYSHLVWSERGMRVMDAPEVVTAAREILKVLQTKDKKHYDTLCKSVGKDETVFFRK